LICVFCTDLKIDDGSIWRTMLVIKVCDQGNIWFFIENSSNKIKPLLPIKMDITFLSILQKAIT
jgi:hypothetical protein